MSIWKERMQVFFQYKDLLFQLVQRDVKLKYRRSFLGYVWSVLNPLLIMLDGLTDVRNFGAVDPGQRNAA